MVLLLAPSMFVSCRSLGSGWRWSEHREKSAWSTCGKFICCQRWRSTLKMKVQPFFISLKILRSSLFKTCIFKKYYPILFWNWAIFFKNIRFLRSKQHIFKNWWLYLLFKPKWPKLNSQAEVRSLLTVSQEVKRVGSNFTKKMKL